jgi:hypothetical protein
MDREEIAQRSRSRKETPGDEGVRLPVPGYASEGGVSDLGVDEPVVEPDERGTPAPPPEMPRPADDEADPVRSRR